MKDDGIVTRKVLITPEMAKRCLAKNPQNRPINEFKVAQYRDDILRGRWRLTHQGIAFDDEGNLIDGQHRLRAIVAAGIPVEMLVTRGLSRNTIIAIDEGLKRSITARGVFLGKPWRKEHGAVARILEKGPMDSGAYTHAVLIEWIEKYWDGLEFAVSHSNGVQSLFAPAVVVIARAAYTRDRERLVEFIKVFKNEYEGDPANRAAITLKKHLRDIPSTLLRNARMEIYMKTEVCLLAFLERRPLTQIKVRAEELFPFPWEREGAAA
jgi:hypothetical protein